jgi:photosystem II stability/assembly factor-like uncharacterized protein
MKRIVPEMVALAALVLCITVLSGRSSDSVGPTWVRLGGPPGGLGYDIRYNFADPNTWYVTDSYAGVFRSVDGGLAWAPSNSGIPSQAGPSGDAIPIFCLTVDPHDPMIVWAGSNPTGRLYRSLDGGVTWQERDRGITVDYGGGLSFRGITVDPRSSDIVYAMGETSDRITGFAVFGAGTGGVIFKTVDGGANWAKIWDGGIPSSLTRYLWVNPQNPDVLYVSTGIFDRGAIGEGDPATDPFGGLGILRSKDGGRTWEILNEKNGLKHLYIGSLTMHPQDPDVLLAAAGHLTPGPYVDRLLDSGHSPMGIYRTTDGGDTWTQVLEPPRSRPGEIFTAVELWPSDPDIGYAGSADAIYRTTDAGLTWELVSGGDRAWGPPGVVAGWPIDLQCDPRDSDRLFANNYNGGNFLSDDGGRTWTNASRGYTGAQVRRVAIDSLDPALVYAAGRSGIWRTTDGGSNWDGLFYVQAGEGPQPPGLEWQVVAADPSRQGHVLGGPGMILETANGGSSWVVRWAYRGEGEGAGPVSIVFAPSAPSTVYAGLAPDGCAMGHEPLPDQCRNPAGGVLVSHDGGTTWAYAVDANTRGISALDIDVDASNPQVVYMASGAGLFKTVDGGVHWVASLSTSQPVRTVAVSPHNPKVVVAGVEQSGVFVSQDGGGTWRQFVSGFDAGNSLHDLVFDPLSPETIYASDYFSGVYRTTDGGRTWGKMNDGLRTRSALGLSISADGHHLYVATNGEGVFRLDLTGQPPVPSGN